VLRNKLLASKAEQSRRQTPQSTPVHTNSKRNSAACPAEADDCTVKTLTLRTIPDDGVCYCQQFIPEQRYCLMFESLLSYKTPFEWYRRWDLHVNPVDYKVWSIMQEEVYKGRTTNGDKHSLFHIVICYYSDMFDRLLWWWWWWWWWCSRTMTAWDEVDQRVIAQTPLVRFVVDLLYSTLYNKLHKLYKKSTKLYNNTTRSWHSAIHDLPLNHVLNLTL